MAEENKNTAGTEPENTPPAEEKTFTQADVDNIVKERLARERSKMPSADEMKAFNEWKKNSQTDAERYSAMESELNSARSELTLLKNQQKVNKSECKPEFAEFVTDRVSRMEGDFEKNLESFKKSNPQYFGETKIINKSTSPRLAGGESAANTTNSRMNAIIRSAAGK